MFSTILMHSPSVISSSKFDRPCNGILCVINLTVLIYKWSEEPSYIEIIYWYIKNTQSTETVEYADYTSAEE